MTRDFRVVNEREAKWIVLLDSVGMSKTEIANRYDFKRMDVVNVLRGNSFSHVTGIRNKNISIEEFITSKRLLKQGHPYRDVADYSGIEANKVRNVMGVMQYNNEI